MSEIKPGRYPGVSNEEYHRGKFKEILSKTKLDAFSEHPSLYLQAMNQKHGGESRALVVGQAFHYRIEHWQDKSKFDEVFVVADGRSTKAKEAKEDPNKVHLTMIEGDDIERMVQAVLLHPASRALLEAPGELEETFVWEHSPSGVLCKCRPDKRLTEDYETHLGATLPANLLIDWKTINGNDWKWMTNRLKDYRYDVQAAWIEDGVSSVLGEIAGPMVHVLVEKGGWDRVLCVTIDESDVKAAKGLMDNDLERFAKSQKSGKWDLFKNIEVWRVNSHEV